MNCCVCKSNQPLSEFSGAQKKKGASERKCKRCCSASEHPVHSPAAVSAAASEAVTAKTTNFQIQLPMVPAQYHQDIVNQLSVENQKLRQERERLYSQLAELAIPADIKKQVAGFEDEISRLKKENESLREENQQLRDKVRTLEEKSAQQQIHIDTLMESYKRENKIALRALFDMAKTKNIALPEKVQKYIKNARNQVNIAAHVVSQERIKAAVDSIPKAADKNLANDIYIRVFPSGDCESEVDDFYD